MSITSTAGPSVSRATSNAVRASDPVAPSSTSHARAWTNTHVNAGNKLTLESGGDTNIKGAVASGKQVAADVGGNLNMESLQDTSTFHSKDQSIAGSVTVGYGFSGSVSASQQKIDSDYASVKEQSGIRAGDGGFQVNVKGNTDLKGATLASTDKAVQDGANSLTTATLTTSEIHNHADYSASSIGIGGGYSTGGGGMRPIGGSSGSPGAGGVGTNQQGQATTGGDKVPGSNLPSSNGFSAAPPIVMGASGSGSSTTVSGISGGAIHITDGAKQQALTGKDADQTVASVNRNVSTTVDTSGSLAPIFNEKEIKTGFEITGAFIRETNTFLNNRAAESTQAQKALDAEKAKPADQQDQAKIAQLTQTLQNNATWGIGGAGRMLMTALTAGAGGNVTGGMGQLAQNATIAYLQELGANKVKEIADYLKDENARAALHAIVGCAGAAASSQSCGAGAMGAAASSVLGSVLASTEGMTPDQKQARENLVNSLVAGLAASTGVNAATATNSAQIELENNQLAPAPTAQPLPSPGQPQKPFQIPGFKGDTAKKGDGVIADPTKEIDPTAGVHASPPSEPAPYDPIVTPLKVGVKSLFDLVLAIKGGDQASDTTGAPPPNMSPDGAGRQGAFNEAKRQNGIPVSQQPSDTFPNTDRRGNPQPGYIYEFTVPAPGGGEQKIRIRDDAAGHFYGDGNAQNRGPHFNDSKDNHYDY
jgi:filamentous hemagglutinin